MGTPIAFGNIAGSSSLPSGWDDSAQELNEEVDERKGAMRAIQIASLDGPHAAKLVEIDEPADDGAVLIDVHAAGVAFPDALQSRGLYQYKPDMPYTPGAEVAGVVRGAPEDAHVKAGDRVAALTMLCGAMAEVVALQPDRVFKLPDTV